MALTRSRALTAPTSSVSPPSTHIRYMSVPIRFQCPLCLDVLRHPIQLPCCQRYLCMECFERGLELTSVNCGFCRRRVVGFARTKQYKVDEVMWKAIKTKCPFVEEMESEPLVEFFDEDAPPLHTTGDNHILTSKESPEDFQAFYTSQLQKHQSQVQEAEQRAFQQTLDFLQNDPELTSALATSSSPASSTLFSISSNSEVSSQGAKKKRKVSATSSTRHRPVTRSLNAVDEKQIKLDDFLQSPHATSRQSDGSGQNRSCDTCSTSVGRMSPLSPARVKMNEPNRKYFLRSTSHSPTSTKERRKRGIIGCKPLRQLTLETTISPIALHTRSQDLKYSSCVDSNSQPSKMLTRQGRRRISWKCVQCTYTNTCFDNRCSMCRCLPPCEVKAYLSLQ